MPVKIAPSTYLSVFGGSSGSKFEPRVYPGRRNKRGCVMGKKRKSIATSLDEVDRNMYATFSSAANSLSQLYTQAMNQQKLSFQAGERHALEKLYHCIRRQQGEGSRVNTMDIVNYIQNELYASGEEPLMTPRAPVQHPNMHPSVQSSSSALLGSPVSPCQAADLFTRVEQCEHLTKNLVFSNAVSTSTRPIYNTSPEGCFPDEAAATLIPSQGNHPNLIQPQNRVCNMNDLTLDMHTE